MPVGPNAHKVPPPWLIAMQRYGPPPSYPNLKIPGLNAAIPEGCSFGYHAGGWGMFVLFIDVSSNEVNNRITHELLCKLQQLNLKKLNCFKIAKVN